MLGFINEAVERRNGERWGKISISSITHNSPSHLLLQSTDPSTARKAICLIPLSPAMFILARFGFYPLARLGCPFLIALLALIGASNAHGDNWGQWRGGNFDSVSSESGTNTNRLPISSELWKFELPGSAGASPVVWGDHIFVSTTDGEALKLICLDTAGRKQWHRNLPGVNTPTRDSGNSAAPSPVTDGQHVWVMMGNGAMACFDFKGNEIWSKDIQKTYGKFSIQFGMSTTPVLHAGKLYLTLIHGARRDKSTSEGQLICLDAASGEEIWLAVRKTDAVDENKHSYSSPIIVGQGDAAVLVVHAADYTTGHAVADGKELWRVAGINPKGENYNRTLRLVASPVARKGLMVVPTAKKGAVIGYQISGTEKPEQVWRLERGTPDVASPVVYRDYVFLAGENGVMQVLDASHGEVLTKKRLLADRHRSTPVVVDGKLVVVGRDGTISIFKADNDLELVSQRKLDEQSVASPAVAGGRIFVRTAKALYAFGAK